MCALKSCGMSAVCTWGLRGIFFLHLYFLCSSPTVLCAVLWQASFLCMYRTIPKTPNFMLKYELERYGHGGYLIKVVVMALAEEVTREPSPILSWSNNNYET
jgi:hypothetical protein